jgi:hypothetical protein
MSRGFLVVEGHGDGQAALNLVSRLWIDLGLSTLHWADPIRGKNLHQERGVHKACELVRSKPGVAGLLLLRDEDDACPKIIAPQTAAWVRGQRLPFPSAVVLAHREYEAFFLPCVSVMAGRKLKGPGNLERPGLLPGTVFNGNPEGVRGVKEWLSRHMPEGHSYKPTVDQLPMTRMITDFRPLRNSNPALPCFGSLERALQFLAAQIQTKRHETYPG